MINSITVTNSLGETINFDLRNPSTSGFFIRGVEGLGPVKATINMTESLSLDGAVYNSARIGPRNILFKLGFLENPSIEKTRRDSYTFFPLKKKIDIVIYTDLGTHVTSGYVESNEPDIFSNDEGTVISVMCPNPFFYDPGSTLVSFSHTSSGFEFPFSNESLTERLIIFSNLTTDLEKLVVYPGDVAIGITMHIHVTGPVVNLEIFNLRTRESMSIDHDILVALTGEGLNAGDEVKVVTNKGQKSVILTRDGVDINILNTLGPGSDWFTLERGDNIFSYIADSGSSNLEFTIEYQTIREGI